MKKILGILLGFFPNIVLAHLVFTEPSDRGFMSGLTHPILGFDHFLAMLSVGILSTQIGGRAIFTVPLMFVVVMLLGCGLGIKNIPLFSIELGIAVSVFVLGLSMAIDKKLPPLFAMLFIGLFGLFHGYAHGIEMPYAAQPFFYIFGFVIGTTAIHTIGIFLGIFTDKFNHGVIFIRYLGAIIAGIGFQFVIF